MAASNLTATELPELVVSLPRSPDLFTIVTDGSEFYHFRYFNCM